MYGNFVHATNDARQYTTPATCAMQCNDMCNADSFSDICQTVA